MVGTPFTGLWLLENPGSRALGPGHQFPGFYTTVEHQLPGNLRTTSSLVQHQSLVALACPGYSNTSTPVWVARDVHVHHIPFVWQVVGGHACGWHRKARGTQWGLSESPLFNGIAPLEPSYDEAM